MQVSMGKFRPTKKGVLSVVGVVVLLGAAAGAGIALRTLQGDKSKSSQDTVIQGEPLPGAAEEVQNLRASGNAKADQVLQNALDNPATGTEERYALYIQQGNALTDKQDYKGAAAAYEHALALKKTYEITLLLGDTYAAAGDNAKAVNFYRQALELMPKSPLQDEDKAMLEQKIKTLGG